MKLDLSKWNPFKFFRKTPEEKRAESSSSTALATTTGNMPAAWPESSRLLMAEPFRMMQELLRDPFAGFGTLVILDHGGNSYSLYGYLAGLRVQQGQRVEAGQELGRVGIPPVGRPALYFEVRVDGRPVDPVQWLQPRPR